MGMDKKTMREFDEMQKTYNVSHDDAFKIGVEYYKNCLDKSEKECGSINTDKLLDQLGDLDICRNNIISSLKNDEKITNKEKLITVLKLKGLMEFIQSSLKRGEMNDGE